MNIDSTPERITVTARAYILTVDKASATCSFADHQGRSYSSFPLAVEVHPVGEQDDAPATATAWERQGQTILCRQDFAAGCWPTRELRLTCFEDAVEFEARVLGGEARPLRRVVCCRRGEEGIFRDPISSIYGRWAFLPTTSAYNLRSDHPDNHYAKLGENLIAANYFEPPPLNVAVSGDAGYLNVGACRLPPSCRFGVQAHGILTEEPNGGVVTPAGDWYAVTPLVFTFSHTPWEGLDRYREHLELRGYVALPDAEAALARPAWWLRPTICTFGEMMTQGVPKDSPEFDIDWCRDFVLGCERDFGVRGMTLILDDKWMRLQNDPEPDAARFGRLREFIDWCHQRDTRVILWWILRASEPGSLAIEMDVVAPAEGRDKPNVDATTPNAEAFIRRCLQKMLGDGPDELNADGLKVDGVGAMHRVRNPELGMGWHELHRFFGLLHRTAREIRPDAMITASSPCPHFADVQDVVRLHDLGWDWRTIREERARVTLAANPMVLIDSDVDPMMDPASTLYHYAMAAVYSAPSLYFLNRGQVGTPIPPENKRIVGGFLALAMAKPAGWAVMVDYGHWRWENREGVIAETLPGATGLVLFEDPHGRARVAAAESREICLPLHGRQAGAVTDDRGEDIPCHVTGASLVFRTSGGGRIDTITLI